MRALALAAASLSYLALPRRSVRPPHVSIVCLNRLLLEPSECSVGGADLVAELPWDDLRTTHVREHLRVADGEVLRAGVLDGGRCEAVVRWVDGRATDGGPDRPSLRLELGSAAQALAPAARPRVDLLLAMPRPPQFARLLPVISSLGVDTLWLTGAARVERGYWSSHLLRSDREAELRAELVSGLAQAGTTALPRLRVERSLRKAADGAAAVPAGSLPPLRLLAHPRRADAPAVPMLLDALARADAEQGRRRAGTGRRRVVIAVGPEGGWEEPRELELLAQAGFTQVTLGDAALRTDVAVVSLLAVINAWLAREEEHGQ
jgi:RsmE family RNA methyltransferase